MKTKSIMSEEYYNWLITLKLLKTIRALAKTHRQYITDDLKIKLKSLLLKLRVIIRIRHEDQKRNKDFFAYRCYKQNILIFGGDFRTNNLFISRKTNSESVNDTGARNVYGHNHHHTYTALRRVWWMLRNLFNTSVYTTTIKECQLKV